VKTNKAKSLPKPFIPGTVCLQMVRCGKKKCHCAKGELHGPYYYHFWRENGRLRKAYVKRSELDRVRTQCDARKQIRRNQQKSWEEWRRIQGVIRETEKSCQPEQNA
jgi:hypothetical protein